MAETEPYDVILALRRLDFADHDELQAWLMAPNDDLRGRKPVALVQAGQYDEVIAAILAEQRRRARPTYREIS